MDSEQCHKHTHYKHRTVFKSLLNRAQNKKEDRSSNYVQQQRARCLDDHQGLPYLLTLKLVIITKRKT